ncbi:MAG: PDZ domain-containing protein [Clostridia bacterium]|nr:PDZ domain-containing protein [Clostridia bacterium]
MSKTKKTASVFFAAVFLILAVAVFPAYAAAPGEGEKTLIAAGVPFGVRLHTDGVIIVGFTNAGNGSKNPAREAGLCRGDVITEIGGKRIKSAKELCNAVESTGGELSIKIKRGGEEKNFTVRAEAGQDGKYKIGVLARDNAAGIGTVTFIDPETAMFAGLGHGICDGETGELVPISYGTCEEVELTEIIKGKKGAPGELRGFFTGKKTGKIVKNTLAGIVGALSEIPQSLSASVYPVGAKEELHSGKAKVITTVEGEARGEYVIIISEINLSGGQKNFTVEITDPALIAKTGGIVQGMSGSPIIQDGKLVGAVTHVMVNDPTRGYGIFIENMLEAAE